MPKKFAAPLPVEEEFFTSLVNKPESVAYGTADVSEALQKGIVAKLLVSSEREGTAGFISEANCRGVPVEMVSSDTEEGFQIKNALGGIAAILKR